MSRKSIVSATVLAAAVTLIQPAEATIIIDSFSTSQNVSVEIALPLPNSRTPDGINSPFSLGGQRSMGSYVMTGAEEDQFNFRVSAPTSTVRFGSDASVRGKGLIQYNGTNQAVGISGGDFMAPSTYNLAVDLTAGGNNGILLSGYADNVGLPVVFTFWNSGARYARGTIQVPGTVGDTFQSYFLPFASFSGAGLNVGETPVDIFRDVRAITVLLDATGPAVAPGTDAVIDYFVATRNPPSNVPPSEVPEPATILLIGSALAGFGSFRRRFAR
jgi:PEP-CTERM motif